MSSFNILSNKSYCRGKRKPRFLNKNVGTHLKATSLNRNGLKNINLVNVKTNRLPEQMPELDSLIIESSYIKNDKTNKPFIDKVSIKKMSVENSDIDSIDHLGLFRSDNNIKSLREKSNYVFIDRMPLFHPFPFPYSSFF